MMYNNPAPTITEFIDVITKYGSNKRIDAFNALQNIPKKSNLFKILKMDIPPEHALINKVDLNKLLKNLIMLTSETNCPLGNYNEYLRYKLIYDKINEGTEEEALKKIMLKLVDVKLKEFSTENEFQNNKQLHILSKKIFIFLTGNSIECTEFYNEICKQIKGKIQGIYMAPNVAPSYNKPFYNKPPFERKNTYQPSSMVSDGFVNITDIIKCPSVNDINEFPALESIIH